MTPKILAGIAWVILILNGAAEESNRPAADPGPAAPQARKELTLALFGSSSTGMLKRYMLRVLNEKAELQVAFPALTGRAPWVRVDWFSEDLERGEVKKYDGYMADLLKLMRKKKFDYMGFQLSGAILWKPEGEKHVAKIVDDLCTIIKQSGNKPLIFEHWAGHNPAKMTEYAIQFGRKHGAKVAFCGTASAEVIAEKGKKYIGGGEGHTNTKGLYLWTCCMYAALTDKSPVGLPLPAEKAPVEIPVPDKEDDRGEKSEAEVVVDVTEADARYLQQKAWEVHQRCARRLAEPAPTPDRPKESHANP